MFLEDVFTATALSGERMRAFTAAPATGTSTDIYGADGSIGQKSYAIVATTFPTSVSQFLSDSELFESLVPKLNSEFDTFIASIHANLNESERFLDPKASLRCRCADRRRARAQSNR